MNNRFGPQRQSIGMAIAVVPVNANHTGKLEREQSGLVGQ